MIAAWRGQRDIALGNVVGSNVFNVFAILGLRSLYFALAGIIQRFRYLKTSLVFLLAFIGMRALAIDGLAAHGAREALTELLASERHPDVRAALRADQEKKLAQARRQFATMRKRMQTARDRVDPVMAVLNDNVLFLKHNLNARAIGSLRNELADIERDTDRLVREMQKAIAEADTFIQSMK